MDRTKRAHNRLASISFMYVYDISAPCELLHVKITTYDTLYRLQRISVGGGGGGGAALFILWCKDSLQRLFHSHLNIIFFCAMLTWLSNGNLTRPSCFFFSLCVLKNVNIGRAMCFAPTLDLKNFITILLDQDFLKEKNHENFVKYFEACRYAEISF